MKLIPAVAAASAVGRRGMLAAQSPTGPGGQVQFSAHEIGTGLRGGYQVVVADLNKDGKPDIIALASGMPELSGIRIPAGSATSSRAAWPA